MSNELLDDLREFLATVPKVTEDDREFLKSQAADIDDTPECLRCKEDGDMVEVRPGIWVCNNCGR